MINQTYNIVQNLLNKNGYGILSPTRFVVLATQVQLSVLNDVITQYRRELERRRVSVTDASIKMYENVLEIFTETTTLSRLVAGEVKKYHPLPDDYMEFQQAFVGDDEIIKVPSRKKKMYERSMLMEPDSRDPICYIEGRNLFVLPDTVGVIDDVGVDRAYDEVDLTYYRYPADPNWTYAEVQGEHIFNPSSSDYQDFELPLSMMPRIATEILALAGLRLRAEYVSRYAEQESANEFNKDNS